MSPTPPMLPEPEPVLDADLLYAHIAWSTETFGPGDRTEYVCDHLASELDEVRADPGDVYEWADVIILAVDGAWRAGHAPDEIIEAVRTKMRWNRRRTFVTDPETGLLTGGEPSPE